MSCSIFLVAWGCAQHVRMLARPLLFFFFFAPVAVDGNFKVCLIRIARPLKGRVCKIGDISYAFVGCLSQRLFVGFPNKTRATGLRSVDM